jgi:hypothetical protein
MDMPHPFLTVEARHIMHNGSAHDRTPTLLSRTTCASYSLRSIVPFSYSRFLRFTHCLPLTPIGPIGYS